MDLNCKKILPMLANFIENKLNDDDKFYVETHLLKCSECYKKYLEMKDVMSNLHFEYEKLMDEFDRLESDNTFNIKEYETFHNNISPYIDDELCYEDSIKFRKYLLNSKSARKELSNAYKVRNNIKQSFSNFTNSLKFNYSKKILKKLKNENKNDFYNIYKRAAIIVGITISLLLILSFIGLNYLNNAYAHAKHKQVKQTMENVQCYPQDEDYIEFIFDENNEALLTAK